MFQTPEMEGFGEDFQNEEVFKDAIEDVNMSAPRIEPADSLKKDDTLSKLLVIGQEPVSINSLPSKLSQPSTKSGMTSLFMDLLILQRENKVKLD